MRVCFRGKGGGGGGGEEEGKINHVCFRGKGGGGEEEGKIIRLSDERLVGEL